jgi:pyrrolidone-carboxylate peptidase
MRRLAIAALLVTLLPPATAAVSGVEEARLPEARAAMPRLLDGAEVDALRAAASREDTDDAIAAATAAGAALWARHRAADGLDDRPLYWQRLAARRALLAAEPARPRRAAVLDAFEWASRGAADVAFASDAPLRVLVTGFDPFLLDADITQSNPSGVAALRLDGRVLEVDGRRAEVQTLVFPVRYDDFDAGRVEALVGAVLDAGVDLVLTVSMGRDAFDLERFPGRRRSAEAPDNRNRHTGADASHPLVPTLGPAPLPGPEFVEFSLPAAAMTAVEGPFPVRDNRTVTTLEDGEFEAPDLDALAGRTAVRGGGGGYLSNEISFRTVRLVRERDRPVAVGHLHTPRMAGHDAETVAAVVTQIETLLAAAIAATGGH